MSAYTSKLKSEVQGRTYKIQNEQHSLNPLNSYRGAAGCGKQNYQSINYIQRQNCCIIPKLNIVILLNNILDGGSPSSSLGKILDGGSPLNSGLKNLNGGMP